MQRIIIIEDIETDAELIQRELKKTSIVHTTVRVETASDFEREIMQQVPDLIVSDYSLPAFNATEALKIRNRLCPDVPFILVTGAQTEEIAVNCIKLGADDYILKSSLVRLPTAAINALSNAEIKKINRSALEQLKLREEKYRNLFENSMVGILRWKLKDGFIVELNQKAREFISYCNSETLLKDCFLNEDDYSKIVQSIREQGFVENYEFQVNTDKSPIWLSLSAKFFQAGEEEEAEGVLQDITVIKYNLIELQKINYELDRFVYHASHDLKSPLKSMMGLIHYLKEEQNKDVIREYVNYMEQSVRRLDNLINDLLSIAHSNNSEEVISNFNFETEINACLSNLKYGGDLQKINIIKNIKQEYPFYTDAVRLRTILNNLLSNALKYHNIDKEHPFISIVVEAQESHAVIVIEDNGNGISESHLPRIFDMFYRAAKNIEGTGLGLYIVKNFIENLKGEISIESTHKQGTKFVLQIPNSPNNITE